MRITILIHEHDARNRPGLIAYLADAWRDMGHEIQLLRGLPQETPAFDVLIPQVDLTVTPDDYATWLDRFPRVLNRRLLDISKRRISTQLLTPGDPWDGPVIIKTNRNYGGYPERRLAEAGRRRSTPRWRRRFQKRRVARPRPEDYVVLDSMAQVPEESWCDQDRVVERFIAEREDGNFLIRIAFVFRDIVLCRKVWSRSPVIKGGNILGSEETEVPEGFRSRMRALGLDYGKVDFVIHDGSLHLLDVNKTPGGLDDAEINQSLSGKLARGIEGLV